MRFSSLLGLILSISLLSGCFSYQPTVSTIDIIVDNTGSAHPVEVKVIRNETLLEAFEVAAGEAGRNEGNIGLTHRAEKQ
jgi:hypothetical protein